MPDGDAKRSFQYDLAIGQHGARSALQLIKSAYFCDLLGIVMRALHLQHRVMAGRCGSDVRAILYHDRLAGDLTKTIRIPGAWW